MTDYEFIEQVATDLRREIHALRDDISKLKSTNDSIWHQLIDTAKVVDGLVEWRRDLTMANEPSSSTTVS